MEQSGPTYDTLDAIREHKLALNAELTAQEKKISTLWSDIFHKKQEHTTAGLIPSPTKRWSSFISTGAGIVDGALLGWKLYRKFKKKK